MKPRLYLDTQLIDDEVRINQALDAVEKYSITPTSFTFRKFFDTLEQNWFMDEYCAGNHKVLRYALDPRYINVDLTQHMVLNEETKTIDLKSQVSESSKSGSTSSKYTLNEVRAVELHSIEKMLLQRAIDYLLSGSDRTVLLDIFARDKGTVKMVNNNQCEIHTILLYKNPIDERGTHEVLVIDPSNFMFSSHLANESNGLHNEGLSKIVTLHKRIEIYKPKNNENVGPNGGQYRDCIDIAVKLAFMLDKAGTLSLEDIAKLDAVRAISNNNAIDDNFVGRDCSVRVKQNSNPDVIKAFYEVEKVLNIITNVRLQLLATRDNVYDQLLANDADNELVIPKLVQHSQDCAAQISNVLDKMNESLVSLIGNDGGNYEK